MTDGNRGYRLITPGRSTLSIERKKRILILVLFAALLSNLFSNPFLGSGEEKAIPAVRPPSSGGFWIEKQLEFRELIAEKLKDIKNSGDKSILWGILGFSFLYGVLHAAGPGHRKTVIFSLFLTRKTRWYEPLLAASLSSAAHGGTALLLILLFQFLFNRLLSTRINKVSMYMEGVSYILLLFISLFFIAVTARELLGKETDKNEKTTSRGIYSTLLISSFFPCPGVIMIMTFSAALGVLSTGILAVLSLSLGMGFTISLAAYLAYFGREGIFSFLKMKKTVIHRTSAILELGSFLFLFLFSLWMAYPFLKGLIPVDL